jgi:CDP-glucose 4,6-dehydratase
MKSLSSVRAGNVIGGGDWQIDRLIPDCIRSLEKSEPIIIRNPFAVRPWQHVLEPLSGYLILASKMIENPDKYNEAWNFGPNDESVRTVGEVTDMVLKFWGEGSWKNISEINAPHESFTLRLDISKTKALLGWKPVWDIELSIKNTVDWYRKYRSKNMFKFCEEQIEMYLEDMSN